MNSNNASQSEFNSLSNSFQNDLKLGDFRILIIFNLFFF